MKPRIGITIGNSSPSTSTRRYVEFIERAGGEAVVLRPDDGGTPSTLDGLLLSGGVDFDPRYYGREIDPATADTLEIDEARDAFELPLARAAIEANVPVLGICRGFQALNVIFGGSLIQHLTGHTHRFGPPGTERVSHDARIDPDSRLAGILGPGPVAVNSSHHQAVRDEDLAPGLRASAWSPDGLIEGLETNDDRWILGIQWHPERVDEVAPVNAELARSLVRAAQARRAAVPV